MSGPLLSLSEETSPDGGTPMHRRLAARTCPLPKLTALITLVLVPLPRVWVLKLVSLGGFSQAFPVREQAELALGLHEPVGTPQQTSVTGSSQYFPKRCLLVARAATFFQQGLKENRVSLPYGLLGCFLTTISLSSGCHFWAFPDWGALLKPWLKHVGSTSRLDPAGSS